MPSSGRLQSPAEKSNPRVARYSSGDLYYSLRFRHRGGQYYNQISVHIQSCSKLGVDNAQVSNIKVGLLLD